MKKGILAVAALLLAPVAASAATYHYVDTTGTVQSTTADSAVEAMNNAPGIAPTSGVALDAGVLDDGDSVLGASIDVDGGAVLGASTDFAPGNYVYADNNMVIQEVRANSAAEAFSLAVNIDEHSGVAIKTGELTDGEPVVQ